MMRLYGEGIMDKRGAAKGSGDLQIGWQDCVEPEHKLFIFFNPTALGARSEIVVRASIEILRCVQYSFMASNICEGKGRVSCSLRCQTA